MSEHMLRREIGDDGVARLTLARPERRNAFDDALIAELTDALEDLAGDRGVRAVVLAAEGTSFSAGADLDWMRRVAGYGEAENLDDARRLAALMQTLNGLGKPTLALVQGPAIGGGVGLVACCDIAIAAHEAFFALSEVRLGLVPAVIAPHLAAAIGERALRRYALTGERFSAEEAMRLGLVHQVVPAKKLEDCGRTVLEALATGGPAAQSACKDLIFAVARRPIDSELMDDTARRIARIRVSDEGQEGIAAFLEKRAPRWRGGA